MTNAEFCYWLQGYFEISKECSLDRKKILAMEVMFKQIQEPLGSFTQWFSDLLLFFQDREYRQETLDFFTPIIQQNLSSIFHHVIDNSYTEGAPPAEWQDIHDGVLQP